MAEGTRQKYTGQVAEDKPPHAIRNRKKPALVYSKKSNPVSLKIHFLTCHAHVSTCHALSWQLCLDCPVSSGGIWRAPKVMEGGPNFLLSSLFLSTEGSEYTDTLVLRDVEKVIH